MEGPGPGGTGADDVVEVKQAKNDAKVPPPPFGPRLAKKAEVKAETVPTHSVDARYPFKTFCTVLESILNKSTSSDRLRILETFWRLSADTVRKWHGQDARVDHYPFLRLLLPHLDTSRLTYGLKASKIAQYYTNILQIPVDSSDAQRLIRWKDPTKTNFSTTHFSDVVYSILVKRGYAASSNAWSVKQINDCLDALADADSPDKKKALLLGCLRATTALEQKWLIRILVKDMRLHLQHASIFGGFHPSAMQLYNASNDLKQVCGKCADPSFLPINENAVSLFQAFTPMLAGLVTKEKFENLLQTEKYTVEPKYDGERMILHYQREPFRLVYLTRNAKDYTDIYGPKFNKSAMASIDRCEDCILDGEVLVWKKSINAFKPFGTNKTFALDAEMTRAGDDADEQFCYMCFDLLYLNGEVLTEYTLEQRRARLAGVVTPQRKKFELVPCLPAVNVRAVFQALDESVQNGFEGVVLKNVNSPYKPAERKLNWLKLKRDHIEGLADTMDLVILGGYYGTKFGRVHVSHFVLGVYCEKERIWYTFTKVGTGYTQVELAVLMSKLERHWKKYDRAHPPPHLGPWKPAADDVPDLWIDPAESVVLEIIGYSFQETTKFLVGRTVRFPRVKHIRTDKTAADAATLEQVVQLMNESNQQKKLAAGLGADYALTRQKRAPAEATLAGGPPVAGSKAKRVAGLLQANTENYMANRPADAVWRSRCKSKGVKVFAAAAPSAGQCALVGGGAEPLRFCVLHSDRSLPKEVLESLIVAHGGDVVPHPVMKSIPVASSAASAKVQHWRAAVESSGSNPGASHKYQHRYVLHHSWIVDCVEAGTLLPCTPRYMVYISPEVQEIFSKTIDKYGDSFVQPSTVESLRSVIDQALASDAGAADKQPADKKSGKKQPKPDDGFTAKIKPTGLKWDPTSTQEAYCVLAELGLVQQGGRKRPLDTGEGDPTGAPGASPLKKRAKEPDSLDDTRPQVGTAAGSLDAGAASGLLSAKKARYAEADLLFTDLVLRFPPPDLLASCSWLQLQLTTAALFNATITFPTPPPTSDATAACKPAPVQLHYAITDESQPSLLLYNREQVHGRVTHTDTPMYPRPLEPLCPLLDCKWIEDSIAAGVLLPTEAYAVPIANLNLSPAAGRGPAESPPDLPIAVVDDRKVGRGQTSCELFSSGSTGHGDPDNACPADTMIGALDNDGDTLHELMDADVS